MTTGCFYTGRGAAGPSIDQLLAAKIGTKSRFRSLQIGVAQESHGENVHRNMSWAGFERALPPEMIPQNLFDRLFGVKNESWVGRKKSVLDLVLSDVGEITPALGQAAAGHVQHSRTWRGRQQERCEREEQKRWCTRHAVINDDAAPSRSTPSG